MRSPGLKRTIIQAVVFVGLLISLVSIYPIWQSLSLSTYAEDTSSKALIKTLVVCSEHFGDARTYIRNRPRRYYDNLTTIYFVTPTYPRREQIPALMRLSHTLLHVPRIHWILQNNQNSCNDFLDSFLKQFGIPFTQLSSAISDEYHEPPLFRPQAAIMWLRRHNITDGVLYFGGDEFTYDLRLFSEIRSTRRVSMFPIGLFTEFALSAPVVRQGKVVGFFVSLVADRRWPVDMAGFSINLAYMTEQLNGADMPFQPGYEEDIFLRSIRLRLSFIEAKADNCTEILVWRTQIRNFSPPTIGISSKYLDNRSNLGALFKALQNMGVARVSNDYGARAFISLNGKEKPLPYFLS